MKNSYLPELASVEDIREETSNIRTLTISLKNKKPLDASPGQFVEITIFGYGEFPVTIAGVLGPKKEYIRATIQQTGKVTKQVGNLGMGSIIGIRGPFGNGFPLTEMKEKNICIVTGGVGLAAVKYLLDQVIENRNQYGNLLLLHGAKNPGDLIYKGTNFFEEEKAQKEGLEILLTVENPDSSWKGHVGVVTQLFDKTEIDPSDTIAVVCGPSVMMKFACERLLDMGFGEDQVFLSMERRMQCGMGMCGHCMIGRKRVCVDGPVFSLEVIKDSLEKVF